LVLRKAKPAANPIKDTVFIHCTNKHIFSALTLLIGQQEGHLACKKLSGGAGMVICLEWGADLHIAQLMLQPLTISCSSKSRLVLPEWFCFSGTGLPRLS